MSIPNSLSAQEFQTISKEELRSKIEGYWLGQLVGNYMGFPFEFVFSEDPAPVFIDKYYNVTDSTGIKMNHTDRRGNVNIFADALGGAWSDDDSDIEFVTLHAVEEHGLDINYEQITQAWKDHINRFIWVSNRKARDLMEEGLVAPETGKKENNPYWFAIDPQLVNEIWSAFYPGMTDKAVERADWSSRITSDDWGTHPTIFYAAMYSAAFFEKDVSKLYDIGLSYIPEDSPFRQGLLDVKKWHKDNPDWKTTRELIKKNYLKYPEVVENPWFHEVSAMVNGLCGAMAVLYGEGDFIKTTGIAVSAGYDCDNQGATCAGLMGVLNGAKSIPRELTHEMGYNEKWEQPFNNQYINYSRDGLPNLTYISDIIDRILAIAETAILENGGKKTEQEGQIIYHIKA
ncbi:ADP-ribosylglycohydrolase family protein [Poritiphilus flavus]|uniref:ADP-ribosylglycohydrolase family protein n=1 Tax=Poritiphilus flavus TaxID=2697053 RepID=A0A6L9EJA8_9FLAO|nr:ADP-ribosylglycohydrolase family protein [Poritiphilus flavus]NAS14259.1 ADP-ribosylglycohydrolase family protein [Poritiphilus flavus]